MEKIFKAKRIDIKKLWNGNKNCAEFMGDKLNIKEAVFLAKKQDALYLAWADGNYERLTGHNTHDKGE